MKDFTLRVYRGLLEALSRGGYEFQRFDEFLRSPAERAVMLRHDIDDRKQHALDFARIQHEMGIVGSYYFRMVPQSFSPPLIRSIASLGHEIGYHYEVMDTCSGNPEAAIQKFAEHLEELRALAPIETICMHGSPRSKYDNRDLWKHYDYRDFGLIGEPYFDIDFQSVFYLTDTGRRWDGHKVSVRDKVNSPFDLSFRSTPEIIRALDQGSLPDQIMLNFHPQRWTDRPLLWWQEKGLQSLKNQVKYVLIQLRERQALAD